MAISKDEPAPIEGDFLDNLTEKQQGRLDQLVLEGIQSGPATGWIRQDVEEIRQQIRAKAQQKKATA